MTAKHPRARLVESVALNQEIKHYVFECLNSPVFHFDPGQFICFLKTFGDKPLKAYYSVASAPDGSNRFELCLNPAQDSSPFGEHLRNLQPGGILEYEGPGGNFRLNDPAGKSIFVAHGTGITPIRSMLLHLLESSPRSASPPLTLIYGARDPEWLLYAGEFEQLQARHANFRFWPTLSRPANGWQGRRGYVQEHLEEAAAPFCSDTDFYLCGRRAMVDEVCRRLAAAGVAEGHIHYEKYG